MGPMNDDQVNEVMRNTEASIDAYGWWNKICCACGRSVGGRLAEYGKPTEADMRYLACPGCNSCASDGAEFRVEFVPGEGER